MYNNLLQLYVRYNTSSYEILIYLFCTCMVGEDPTSEVKIVICKDSDYSHQWAEDVVKVFWVPKYKYSHNL